MLGNSKQDGAQDQGEAVTPTTTSLPTPGSGDDLSAALTGWGAERSPNAGRAKGYAK